MNKAIKFGEAVKGYDIPVLNEREIRASAGILFLVMLISLMLISQSNSYSSVRNSLKRQGATD